MGLDYIDRVSTGDIITAEHYNRVIEEVSRLRNRLNLVEKPRGEFLGQITSEGPNGEPDFCDNRYWVRETLLKVDQNEPATCPGHVSNPTDPFDPGSYDISPAWINEEADSDELWLDCINLDEVESASHALTPGLLVHVFEMTDTYGGPRMVFRPGGGVGGAEVRIARAIVNNTDPELTPEEIDRFDKLLDQFGDGSHLHCVPIRSDGSNGTAYVVVHPLAHLSVTDFLNPDGSQIYNAADPDDPAFLAIGGRKGLTLAFLVAEIPVAAPDPAELCT